MEPQLHKILITLVVVGMMITGIVLFMNGVVSTYNVDNYDNSSINSLNKMSELNDDIGEFEDESTGIGDDEKNDILGGFFKSAYQSAQVLKGSVSVTRSMAEEAIDTNSQNMGGMGSVLKQGLGLIIVIIIIIGIFLAFITKSNRT